MNQTLTTLLVSLLILVILAAYLRWQRGRAPMSGDPDETVIRALQEHGADVAKPTTVRLYLYLPDEERARAAADRLRQPDDQITIEPGADGVNWLCLIERVMPPGIVTMRALRRQLTSLASELGGEYDGWEAAVAN